MSTWLACGSSVVSIGLILVMVGMSSTHWSDLDNATDRQGDFAPDLQVKMQHFGLYTACFVDSQSRKTCRSFGSNCDVTVCIRINSNTVQCHDLEFMNVDISNCDAFIATRVMSFFCLIFGLFGVISISCTATSRMERLYSGFVETFFAAICGMIAMSVFVAEVYKEDLNDDFNLGYSFALFTSGWALMMVGSCMACMPARIGVKSDGAPDPNEVSMDTYRDYANAQH